ncbi:MAG TPA: 4a-hydroxytetrahydrobiopterin dehydratase [Nocardioides sp.]|nr:4a-hydroxytetrahydrobiopterin dehydratase [Nocardioides sp.]
MSDGPGNPQWLSGDEVATLGLHDWRPILGHLEARFATGSFATGLELANRIGELAEAANHHPDLDLRYPHLGVKLTSHDVGNMTRRDVDLARQISDAAADLGIQADPSVVQEVELGLDTWDADAIRPFWAAVYGIEEPEGGDVIDPDGTLPTIWFQESDEHPEPHQRFHLDLRVPPEEAQGRIDAALAAGGVLVADDQAPRFTVLADAQGNKVCICTHVGRRYF